MEREFLYVKPKKGVTISYRSSGINFIKKARVLKTCWEGNDTEWGNRIYLKIEEVETNGLRDSYIYPGNVIPVFPDHFELYEQEELDIFFNN